MKRVSDLRRARRECQTRPRKLDGSTWEHLFISFWRWPRLRLLLPRRKLNCRSTLRRRALRSTEIFLGSLRNILVTEFMREFGLGLTPRFQTRGAFETTLWR